MDQSGKTKVIVLDPIKGFLMKKLDLELVFNNLFRRTSRVLRKQIYEQKAAIRGQRFYCAALSGLSSYNICINCDMTVSCNCRDYDGSGHIGDLHANTFQEVFSSPTSSHFRTTLASGKLPLLTCASCPELRMATQEKAEHYLNNYSLPISGLMIENTIACNLWCSGCSREEVVKTRSKKAMNSDDMKIIASFLKEAGITSIWFFNLGEPFSSPRIYEHLSIIRAENPDIEIVMSTNGTLLNNDDKRKAALLCNHIYFSIDGPDNATVLKYQRGGNFQAAYENMKKLIEFRDLQAAKRPTIEWKYVLFNWNDRPAMVRETIDKAKGANVDRISFWPTPMPVYGISWRYRLDPFYKNLGNLEDYRREIILRHDIGENMPSPG
jgi:hypothetical protein